MTGKDEYYNRAKQEGYRARSAYKLKQLDETADLLGRGDTVVDLGAAPGGWLQVAAERVGSEGRLVGVDRQRIDPIETEATVECLRGDVTEDRTHERIAAAVEESADLVVSDMAPNVTGEYNVDHARSVYLVRQALAVATAVLRPGGDFLAKVFDGRDLEELIGDAESEFEYVREVRPEASRDASSELYLIGKGRLTAPVRAGEELTVEIVDVGDEGDGIARVEGFTLFVPGAEVGERRAVRVTEVQPRYGFTQPVE
ncbi:23S rRNA (uridine(2552)-2'-O)-methyltransferase [Halobacteriales archaeon QH_10_67_13]|nr:MAG: 23S rRNA (uridine(2552)-2'-O)-methyltransferase [Halobacteriales archaeon QH_10_67_13]